MLEGKNAVVTGGASGIGKAILKEFVQEGAHVVVLDNNSKKLSDLVQEISSIPLQSASRGRWGYHPVDISNRAAVEHAFKMDAFQDADTLINNAGIDVPFNIEKPDWETWERIYNVNVRGAMYMTEFFVSSLKKTGRIGSIIFITSVHTVLGFRNSVAYDASKGALLGAVRALALDLAPQIRVNAVAPGGIYPTGITRGLSIDKRSKIGSKIPLGFLGLPEDIAHMCAFLASDKASYITGQQIVVDGGLTIQSTIS